MALRYWEMPSNIHLDPINKFKKHCVRIITVSHYFDSTKPTFQKTRNSKFKKKLSYIEYL